jgi:hypothetical protein
LCRCAWLQPRKGQWEKSSGAPVELSVASFPRTPLHVIESAAATHVIVATTMVLIAIECFLRRHDHVQIDQSPRRIFN